MKSKTYNWYYFADGYYVCARGFSSNELKVEEQKHGSLVETISDAEYNQRLEERRNNYASVAL